MVLLRPRLKAFEPCLGLKREISGKAGAGPGERIPTGWGNEWLFCPQLSWVCSAAPLRGFTGVGGGSQFRELKTRPSFSWFQTSQGRSFKLSALFLFFLINSLSPSSNKETTFFQRAAEGNYTVINTADWGGKKKKFVCFPKQIQLNTSKRVSSPGEILAKRLGGGSRGIRQLRGMRWEAGRGEPPFSCSLRPAYFFFSPDYLEDYFFCGDREKCMSLKHNPKNNRLLRKRKNELVDGRFHASVLKPVENLHYSSVAF